MVLLPPELEDRATAIAMKSRAENIQNPGMRGTPLLPDCPRQGTNIPYQQREGKDLPMRGREKEEKKLPRWWAGKRGAMGSTHLPALSASAGSGR